MEFRVNEKEKEKIDRAIVKSGLKQSEYLRQRALGYEPKAALPDAFFTCCEQLDRVTRQPFSKDVNEAALAVLSEMKDILTGKVVIPAEKENIETAIEPEPIEPKPKRRLFGRR